MKKEKGVSLLEVLLVMVIALTIIYLSLQQYLTYRRDGEIRALQSNIDLLFATMAKYFQANCRSAPFNTDAFLVHGVTLQKLLDEGYLTLAGGALPLNPLVDNAQAEDPSYVLQFNQLKAANDLLPQRTVKTCLTGDGCPVPVGSQAIWQIQVSVRVYPDTIKQYESILGAECTSTYISGWGVTQPCPIASGGNYLVFTRSPALPGTSSANSNLWLTMPMVKQFSQMYTTDPILILTYPNATQVNAQFYICGTSPKNFCGGDVSCP